MSVTTTDPWHDLQVPHRREPQSTDGRPTPAGLRVVSADSHWSLAEDIFWTGFPARLRARAPRVWFTDDGIPLLGNPKHEPLVPPPFSDVLALSEGRPGAWQIDARVHDLELEGIDVDIAFPNAILGLLALPELEIRELVFSLYNQHLAATQQRAPGRFYGVGLLPFWNPSRTTEALAELVGLGLKTFVLPNAPRDGAGNVLNYADETMDPFWSAVEEAGLPVCFHVGESLVRGVEGPNQAAVSFLVNSGPFRHQFGSLVFGGVLDRHPGLRIVFAEADINWVPGCVQQAEMLYSAWHTLQDPRPRKRPSEYWHENMYATFQRDPVGLRVIDLVGSDRVLWASDYPHLESTLGFGRDAISDVLDAVPESDARRILGDNARALFDLGE